MKAECAINDNIMYRPERRSTRCCQYSTCVQSQATLSARPCQSRTLLFLLTTLSSLGRGKGSYYYDDDDGGAIFDLGSGFDKRKMFVILAVAIICLLVTCCYGYMKKKSKERARNATHQLSGTVIPLTGIGTSASVPPPYRHTNTQTTYPYNQNLPSGTPPSQGQSGHRSHDPPAFRYTDPVASFQNYRPDYPSQIIPHTRTETDHEGNEPYQPPPFRYTDPVASFEPPPFRHTDPVASFVSSPRNGQGISQVVRDADISTTRSSHNTDADSPPPYRYTDPIGSFSPQHIVSGMDNRANEPAPPSYDSLFNAPQGAVGQPARAGHQVEVSQIGSNTTRETSMGMPDDTATVESAHTGTISSVASILDGCISSVVVPEQNQSASSTIGNQDQ